MALLRSKIEGPMRTASRAMAALATFASLLVAQAVPALAHDRETLTTTADVIGIMTNPKACDALEGGANAEPGPLEVGETIHCVSAHVQDAKGDGALGPVILTMSGPSGSFSEHLYANEAGVVVHRLAASVKPGTYRVQVRYRGFERSVRHTHAATEPPQGLVKVLLASRASAEYKAIEPDLKVTFVFEPSDSIKSGYTRVGGQPVFQRSGKCISGCATVTLRVRDREGRAVKNAEVKVDTMPIPRSLIGGDPSAGTGMICKGRGLDLRCSEQLHFEVDVKGEATFTYWAPGVIEKATAKLTANATSELKDGDKIKGSSSRNLQISPNLAMPANRVSLGAEHGGYLGLTIGNAALGMDEWYAAAKEFNSFCEWTSEVSALVLPEFAFIQDTICKAVTMPASVMNGMQALLETGLVIDSYCVNPEAVTPWFNARVLLEQLPVASMLVRSDFLDVVHQALTQWAHYSTAAGAWRAPASDHIRQYGRQVNGQMEVTFIETSAMAYVNRTYPIGPDHEPVTENSLQARPALWAQVWISQGPLGMSAGQGRNSGTIINGYNPQNFLNSNLGCGRG